MVCHSEKPQKPSDWGAGIDQKCNLNEENFFFQEIIFNANITFVSCSSLIKLFA